MTAVLLAAALAITAAPPELRWGADPQGGAPHVFPDPADPSRVTGFEHELVGALAERAGMVPRMVTGPWDRLEELLDRGDIDVVINGLEDTPTRREAYLLSRPYFVSPLALTVRADDPGAPTSAEALKGRSVGTLPGSLAARVLESLGAEVRTYEGGQDDVYKDLLLHRTDAVVMDGPVAHYFADVDARLRTLDVPLGNARYVMVFRKADAELHARLDKALGALMEEGALHRVYASWDVLNRDTVALLGGPRPVPTFSPHYESWRVHTVGGITAWDRLTRRYPAMLPLLLRGAALTLLVSACAMALAVLLGVLLALARWKGSAAARIAATAYVEVFRGTPLLIQLTMVYFGLPELGVKLPPLVAGVVALGLNYAAAEAENYRAGLSSIPAGQMDAARVLGLTPWQAFRFVALPQALRVSLPPSTTNFVALLKDSSLISVVTLTELTRTYVNLANATRDHLGLGAVVAVLYLLLGLPFVRLNRHLEERLSRHLHAS